MNHMNHPEWGTKRICQACAAKYYDLDRAPIICPKCQVEFVEIVRAKTSASAGKARAGAAGKRPMPFGRVEPTLPQEAEERKDSEEIEDELGAKDATESDENDDEAGDEAEEQE